MLGFGYLVCLVRIDKRLVINHFCLKLKEILNKFK